MSTLSVALPAPTSRWIVSRRFDLAWFFERVTPAALFGLVTVAALCAMVERKLAAAS